MSNIRVDLDYSIRDGLDLKFRSPVDCSAITGLIVYYPGADGNMSSKVFALADAHGNNVGNIDHLFAENVVVKVILDVTNGMAFVQNADTNAYLEAKFASKAPAGYGLGERTGRYCADCYAGTQLGLYYVDANTANLPTGVTDGVLLVEGKPTTYNYGVDFYLTLKSGTQIWHCYYSSWADRWQPWECENPPMELGVEYRTSERWNGKPVYKMSLKIDALPSNTYQSYTHGKIVYPISISLASPNQYVSLNGHRSVIECKLGTRDFTIGTNADMSAFDAIATMTYAKD